MNKYKKNIKLFTLYSLFTGKLFVGTTQVLFLTFKGFSFTQIMLISTITGFVSLVLEIPSGMLADKMGYKKCICSGLTFTILGYVTIMLATNFTYIILYSFLIAVGSSVISGADSCLLYESLNKLGMADQFKDTIRKINSIKMYFVAIVTILSGFLFMLNEYLPFLCTTILYVIALFISLFFTDIKVEEEEEELKLKDYFILSIKSIKENKRLRWLMIAGSFFTIFFINQNVLLQQYMSDIKFNVSLFGIVFFLYNMLTAFVSKRSDVLEKKFGKHTKVVFTLLIAVCFISAGFAKSIVGIVILALCRVSVATINPIILTEVNDQIGSRNRATLLSFYNAVTSIADSLFSPIIGFGIDGFGIFSTYIILGLCGFVFVFFLLTEKVTCMSSDNLSSHNNY